MHRSSRSVPSSLRRLFLVAPVAGFVPLALAQKSSVSSSLPVMSIMPVVAELHATEMPAQWVISPQEAQAGQTAAVNCTAQVHANDPAGYQLMFRLSPGAAVNALIDVQGSGTLVVSPPGQVLRRPHVNGNLETVRFSVRFNLMQGTQPGVQPWPIQLAMLPL